MKAQALLLALLVLPAAQAAPFLMERADAMQTGFVDDPGPETLDTAFTLPLDGRVPARGSPLILGGQAYVVTSAHLDDDNAGMVGGKSTVWRIDLAQATVEPWIDLGTRIVSAPMASDGELLLLVLGDDIEAYDLADGSLTWSQRRGNLLPPSVMERLTFVCPYAAHIQSTFLLVCKQELGWRAWSLNATSGEVRWTVNATDSSLADEYPAQAFQPYGTWAATTEKHLVVATTGTGLYPYHLGNAVVLRLDDGAWAQTYLIPVGGSLDESFVLDQTLPKLAVTGTAEGFVLHRSRHVAFYRVLVDSVETWEIQSPFGDDASTPPPVTVVDDSIYVPRSQAVFRAALGDARISWPQQAADAVTINNPGATEMLANEEHVWLTGAASGLYVLAAEDGRILDQTTAPRMGGFVRSFGLGEGVIVAHVTAQRSFITGGGGLPDTSAVAVIGTTPASIGFSGKVSDTYPAVDGTVTVQAALQRAGMLAPDASFSVEWGDGQSDELVEGRATHAYGRPGDFVIRLVAENSAGQEASQRFTVHVGQQPPNFISTAFSPENQEQTFFLLGVILTLLFAGFGVLRLRRKRGILQRELRAVDAVIENAKDDPAALQAALQERRAHARGLLADGKIEDAHHTVLQHYIDDASTRTRVGTLESELPFLPLGLAQALKEMLGDAKITDWEHRHFVEALGKDALLTATQKKKVQRLVDAWFAQDRGVV